MNLIIVESPTKARTLSRFLGKGYAVEATMGHIKDLPKSKLGVQVEKNFEPDYQLVEGKSKQVNAIKKSYKTAKSVYIATDPDREGEAIAQHVYEILDGKNGKIARITFHEITKSAVDEAISKPGKINNDLVEAQVARRVLDRLVGYKTSPLLWKKVRRGLSAGRVQTVTVRLIVEREREIEAFVPQEYWEIYCELRADLSRNNIKNFVVKLLRINGKTANISDKSSADKAVGGLKKSAYTVADVARREVRKNPYPPFTTSTLSQTASRFFGWSSKKTMSVAQRLYEEGLITYHRTDSVSLSSGAIDKVREYIGKEYGAEYVPEKPKLYKTKSKSAQEAHEAIRPTDVNSKLTMSNPKFQKEGEKLYGLIWKRFVACQMNPAVYDETKITVSAKYGGDEYTLRASGQVMKFDGWRKVIPPSKSEEPSLPDVQKNDSLTFLKIDPQQKFTQPPPRYNEASLIKTLEKLGIGRPSTYAPTISTIQSRAYVEKKEGKFYPTSIGIAVNDFLTKNFSTVFDYDFTADMEEGLDNVAQGKVDWHKMLSDFWGPFEKKLESVEANAKRVKIETEKLGKKCPTCSKEGRKGDKQGELVVRTGRFGKFISCSIFPDCKHTEKYMEKIDMKCPDCKEGEVIVKRTRKGRQFFGCSRYPDCEFASWKNPQKKSDSDEE